MTHPAARTLIVLRRLARGTMPLALVALLRCSSASTSAPAVCGKITTATPTGRPVAAQCAPSNVLSAGTDGGLLHCTTDSDCGTTSLDRWCRGGQCEADQCSSDTDCASGQACACADEQIGNAEHTNVCLATHCRVDADCGSGEACSPTAQDLCSGGPFFACHSAADTCRVDADCCASAPSCRYQPMSGHWDCVAACTIAG
jgi:hypothetical protein